MTTKTPERLPLQPWQGGFAPDAVSTVLVSGARTVGSTTSTGPLLYVSDTRFGSAFGLPLHRHEALETITVVLDGRSQHFDTDSRRWFDLDAGDVQVMRAGTGLSHAERVVGAARVLQIMVDPGPRAAAAAPTYADHRRDAMPVHVVVPGVEGVEVVGGGAPASSAGDLVIRRLRLQPRARTELPAEPGRTVLLHVLSGSVDVDGLAVRADDVVRLDTTAPTALIARESAEVLVLGSPRLPHPHPSR